MNIISPKHFCSGWHSLHLALLCVAFTIFLALGMSVSFSPECVGV